MIWAISELLFIDHRFCVSPLRFLSRIPFVNLAISPNRSRSGTSAVSSINSIAVILAVRPNPGTTPGPRKPNS